MTTFTLVEKDKEVLMKSNDTEFIQKELIDLKSLMFGIDDLITDIDSRILEMNKYFIETEEYSMGELLDMMFSGLKKSICINSY